MVAWDKMNLMTLYKGQFRPRYNLFVARDILSLLKPLSCARDRSSNYWLHVRNPDLRTDANILIMRLIALPAATRYVHYLVAILLLWWHYVQLHNFTLIELDTLLQCLGRELHNLNIFTALFHFILRTRSTT